MKKMINSLCGIFLTAAVMVMPLCGMQLGVVREAANNVELLNEIVEQMHKAIDAALGTFTSVDQKQQGSAAFEEAKKELVQLMEKIDLATIDLAIIDLKVKTKMGQLMKKIDLKAKIKLAPLVNKIDIKTKAKLDQLMRKIDDLDGEAKKAMSDPIKTIQASGVEEVAKDVAVEISLLDQIVEQAKNIIEGPFESRPTVRKELDRLMNNENLDIATKFKMSDDIETIKQAAGKNIIPKVSDAYKHLQSVVADRKAQLGVVPQSKVQQAIDYVSRKYQEAKQTVRALWYGASA